MAPQQERARRTRAAIVESAAAEFSKRGYAAASINAILEHSNATKGAMYFHFDSKEDLARAVLEEGSSDTGRSSTGGRRLPGSTRSSVCTAWSVISVTRCIGTSSSVPSSNS